MLILNRESCTVRKKTNGVHIRWGCTKVKKLGCKGAVTTDDPSGNARNLTAHNHGTNATDVELKRFRADLRETAVQSTNLCVQYRNNVWTNNIFEYLRRISYNVRYN